MKIIYQAIDGRQFETKDECLTYEYSKLRLRSLYFDGQKIVEDKETYRFCSIDNPIAAQIEGATAIEFKNKQAYDTLRNMCDEEGIEFPECYGSGIWVWNELEWVDAADIEKHPEFGAKEIKAWKEYLEN